MSTVTEGNSIQLDDHPPVSLDKFIQESGLSEVSVWRYRKKGWLNTVNIGGRLYVTRAEIAKFNQRAASGEFATERKPGIKTAVA